MVHYIIFAITYFLLYLLLYIVYDYIFSIGSQNK